MILNELINLDKAIDGMIDLRRQVAQDKNNKPDGNLRGIKDESDVKGAL